MYVCDWSITSALVDEFAERLPDREETDWRVSWLPGRLVTRAQAIAAMELVEMLYDRSVTDTDTVQATIAATAAQLGIRPIDVAVALSSRHPNP
ncbi:hypothetical protein D7D52_29460 [Nocardia yunnanensis]|uniref:Uncharacterized protein n=1 Tax=Nocardia yunnanensis TaxID=2382165 RepID=A0A386ZI88_9NOCA|nr:hypothetical protein [Nocardia yunnanensis]AYF77268.1 hypothetical protein D7D52_29460 [Nocardia yunnanensis]